MGLLSSLLGLAGDADVAEVARDLEALLAPNESVELAFKLVRDQVVFTDRRLIFVDKQGVTGRKRQYHSIPYRSITMFSIETAGTFDTDSEMTIWVSGQPQPFVRELSRLSNISGIQKALAQGVMPAPR